MWQAILAGNYVDGATAASARLVNGKPGCSGKGLIGAVCELCDTVAPSGKESVDSTPVLFLLHLSDRSLAHCLPPLRYIDYSGDTQ